MVQPEILSLSDTFMNAAFASAGISGRARLTENIGRCTNKKKRLYCLVCLYIYHSTWALTGLICKLILRRNAQSCADTYKSHYIAVFFPLRGWGYPKRKWKIMGVFIKIWWTRTSGRYAPFILGLPAGFPRMHAQCRGPLLSLLMPCTQGHALLASHAAHAKKRQYPYIPFPQRLTFHNDPLPKIPLSQNPIFEKKAQNYTS